MRAPWAKTLSFSEMKRDRIAALAAFSFPRAPGVCVYVRSFDSSCTERARPYYPNSPTRTPSTIIIIWRRRATESKSGGMESACASETWCVIHPFLLFAGCILLLYVRERSERRSPPLQPKVIRASEWVNALEILPEFPLFYHYCYYKSAVRRAGGRPGSECDGLMKRERKIAVSPLGWQAAYI